MCSEVGDEVGTYMVPTEFVDKDPVYKLLDVEEDCWCDSRFVNIV